MPCLPGRSTRVHCKFAYAKRFGNFVSFADFAPGLDLVACSLALDCRLSEPPQTPRNHARPSRHRASEQSHRAEPDGKATETDRLAAKMDSREDLNPRALYLCKSAKTSLKTALKMFQRTYLLYRSGTHHTVAQSESPQFPPVPGVRGHRAR